MEPTVKSRISSIDIARGVIMVIMALDHIRDFFHKDAFLFSPTDLTKTNGALFFTRWITHFCAPAFVLLAGAAIAIHSFKVTKKNLSLFLVTRGLWLIVLDVTVMRFALLFNFYYDVTFLSVLWMIGFCLVCMAAIVHMNWRWVLVIGIAVLFGHNAFDGVSVQADNPLSPPWLIAMRAGFIPLDADHALITSYALVPWLSVMMLGYALGHLFSTGVEPNKRIRVLMMTGSGAIVFFFILRLINLYGDPSPWSDQPTALFSLLSFFNVTKYPVSLQFILMTTGPLLIALGLLEKYGREFKAFRTIGRVPLFYFVGHFLLAHATALVLLTWREGKSFNDIDFHFSKSFGGITAGSGVSLAGVYIAWMIIVAIMYFLCVKYERYKRTHHYWWLSYL